MYALNEVAAMVGGFLQDELGFLTVLNRQVAGGGRKPLAAVRGCARSIENQAAILQAHLIDATCLQRRQAITHHLPSITGLKCGLAGTQDALRRATPEDVTLGAGLRETEQVVAAALLRLDALGVEFGAFENPARAELENLQAALKGSEPDAEEYLARYTRELGLPSGLRVRDAVAAVVYRGGWQQPRVAGHERAYVLKAVAGLLAGRDDLNRLDESITVRDTIDEAGKRVRGVPIVLSDQADVLLYGSNPSEDLRRHHPQLMERRSLDLAGLDRLALPPDVIAVLRAKLECVPFRKLPEYLTEQTGEPWDMRRVWAADQQLARKRGCLRSLATTTYTPPGAQDTAGLERLPSGRLLWSQRAPDPEVARSIVAGLPIVRRP